MTLQDEMNGMSNRVMGDGDDDDALHFRWT